MAVRTKRGAGPGKKADRAKPAPRESDLRFQALVDSGQALIWTSGKDKQCDYFNLPWLRFRGRTLEQEVGDGWLEGVHPDDLKSFIERYQSAFDRRDRFSIEFRLRRYDGEFRWIQDDGTPRFDIQGNFLGYIGHCLDVTGRKRAEEKSESLLAAVQEERTMLSTLIDSITDEVWFADSEGRFTLANPAALKEFALDLDRPIDVEAFAKSLEVFRPDGSPRPVEEAPPLRALSGEVIRNQEEIVRTPATSGLRSRLVSAAPVRDPEGRIIGAVSVVRDITNLKRAEENLRSLSRRQEAILAAVVDIIMEVDTEKVYTWANSAGLEFFGEDVIGKEAASYFIGEQETYAAVKPLFNGRDDVFYIESWQRRKDGAKRLLAWWCHVLKDAEGNVTGALSTARDITERKRSEERLQESRTLYESIFEATGTATLLVEEDATIAMANRECLAVTGYSPEELVRTRWPSYVAPESLEMMLRYHKLRREEPGKAPDKYEVRLANKKGQIRHVVLDIMVIPGTRRSVVSMLDVTDRKQAEEALRESEDKYRTLIENAGEAIFVVQGGRLVFCNPMTVRLMGYSSEELCTRSFAEFIHPDDRDMVLERHQKRLRGEEAPGRYIVRLLERGGDIRWAEISVILFDWGGQAATLNFASDVTQRIQAEETLRESEEQLRAVMEEAPDGVYLNDLAGNFLYGNRKTEEIIGYAREEIVGKNMMELNLLDPEGLARGVDLLQVNSRGLATGPDEMILNRKDGRKIIVEINTSLVRRRGQPVVIGFVRDITERKLAEEKLRESEKRYRELYDFLPIPVYEMDLQANITAANRAVFEAFRGTEDDFKKGFNAWTLLSPEDIEKSALNIQRLLRGEAVEGTEYAFTRLDGSTFPAIVISSVIFDHGRPIGLRGAIIDITERKQAEDRVQESLREKEVLLREIHHRVKNNMQVISSLFNLEAGHITAENARRMLKEGQLRIRSMALVHEKLYQSRDLSKIDFADYLRSLAAHLFHFFRVEAGRIRLETKLESIQLNINSAVPCGLLVNELVSNALKHAFPEDRKGTVEVGLRRSEDGNVELRVADDGVGLPGTLDFRRTESLGLQIVALLVNQLDGTIELGTGSGTDFTIVFHDPEDKPKT